MTPFKTNSEVEKNLLPFDGSVHYYGQVFSESDSSRIYFSLMNEILWEHDQAMMFGKKIITKRKVAWYAEQPCSYTYSKITKTAHLFNPLLAKLKTRVEEVTSESFNSCLLNLYHDGSEGMAYHSDGEKELKKDGAIASLSFGAKRKFSLKHKSLGQRVDVWLPSGSLLLMKGETQEHWLHRLPPTKLVKEPRINLTFRFMES